MSTRWINLIGALLILAGLAIGYPAIQRAYQDSKQQVAQSLEAPQEVYAEAEAEIISGQPIRIEVPSVAIDLEIVDGFYNEDANWWSLSKTLAQFAKVSSPPNNKAGNTFIYGHNAPKVFSKLPDVQIGDKAIVTTSNGHSFIYEYYSLNIVSPDDVSIFSYQGSPILTMQTCSGAWYQNRSLYVFGLKEVQ